MQLSRTSVLVAPVVIGLLFATTLVGIDRLAFRDVSHFYTPLYDYVAGRTAAQWLPLWNPLDQTGVPLVGETSTAVFYPVRYLLFLLPISSEVAMAWYVSLHLVLASFSAWACARLCGMTRSGASIASVIYPLSGAVLFLYTNPPFLVGAAWLPLVLGPIMGRRPASAGKRILFSAGAMSMMVLGGDPQTALHAMLVATAVSLVRLCRRKHPRRWTPLIVSVLAPVLAAALAAPQIAASLSWASVSDRVQTDVGSSNDLFAPPRIDGRKFEAFQFSLPPWHCAEIVTPTAFGRLLPINRRISMALPGDGRTWTPSIYLGMLAAIAMLSRIVNLRRYGIDAWLVIAIASLLLSMGNFGAVWWIQNASGLWQETDSAVGGPYWLLYHFLPGYDAFRYPAKWLPLFSLSAAMISARWVDRDAWRETIRTRRVTILLFIVLTLASLLVYWLRLNPTVIADPATVPYPADRFWGPLDISGGLAQIQRSLLHSVLVVAAITFVLRLRARKHLSRRSLKVGLFALVLVDLAISSDALIATVPISGEKALVASLERDNHALPSQGNWMRTQSRGGWPKSWRESRNPNRLVDVEVSSRHAWFGRWHLAEQQAVLNNMTSISSRRMALFWQATALATSGMDADRQDEFWRSMRRWLSIGGTVHTTDASTHPAIREDAQLVDVNRVYHDLPATQVHHQWKTTVTDSMSVADIADMLGEINQRGGNAITRLEADRGFEPKILPSPAPANVVLSVLETDSTREAIQIMLKTDAPVLLSRPVIQDRHWRAEYTQRGQDNWRELVVYPVDQIKQGVIVPAGDWRIRFRYQPGWVKWSLPLSGLIWLLFAASIIQAAYFPMQKRPKTRSRISSV